MLSTVLALTLLSSQAQSTLPSASPAADCAISAEQLKANAVLTFEQFDQKGASPATARQLANRKCYREAAIATEHYLLNGPVLSEREHNVVSWHLSQYLAGAGDEVAAARVAATAIRPPSEEPDGFDWNAYVRGTWAFLIRDRALLDQLSSELATKTGFRNNMNSAVLRRFQKCFDKPYVVAYDSKACAVDVVRK